MSQDISNGWFKYVHKLKMINAVHYKRCVLPKNEPISIEAHGFCDSSNLAYGAAIYVRTVTRTNFHTSLWTAKSRIVPSKETNIPRLELLDCLLLSKLMDSFLHAVKDVLVISKIICWSDSQIALWWVKQNRKEWKPWVENRVTKIRNLDQTSNWRYTRTKENPADLLTRKADPSALINNEMWAKGPAFLRKSEDYWEFVPVDEVEHDGAKMEEKRKTMSALSSTVPRIGNIIDCTK